MEYKRCICFFCLLDADFCLFSNWTRVAYELCTQTTLSGYCTFLSWRVHLPAEHRGANAEVLPGGAAGYRTLINAQIHQSC